MASKKCDIEGCTFLGVFTPFKCKGCNKRICRDHAYLFRYSCRKSYDNTVVEGKTITLCAGCAEAILEIISGE